MKKTFNRTHIEGFLYEHDLQLRTSGEKSKNPGTEFIMGNVHIATDDKLENVIAVHFSYVTATTAKGNANATFTVLKDIYEGKYKSVTEGGVQEAVKLRIDSAIGLNEFYTDRNGTSELISAKRNEGGFVHVVTELSECEKDRNTFETDILITGVTRVEADEEKNLPEKVNIKGCIFDFKGAVLPVEFIATNEAAMNYFEDLGASSTNPIFTKVRGQQISTVTVRKIVEESAFGDASVREVKNSRKDYLVTWAQGEPYAWDDEETITAQELTDALANREVYLASVKQRQDEYNASRGQGKLDTTPAKGGFNF